MVINLTETRRLQKSVVIVEQERRNEGKGRQHIVNHSIAPRLFSRVISQRLHVVLNTPDHVAKEPNGAADKVPNLNIDILFGLVLGANHYQG